MGAIIQNYTTDIDGFLTWLDANTPEPPKPATAEEALAKLKAANFGDFASVLALAEAVDGSDPIPLFQTPQRHYFVVTSRPVLSVAASTAPSSSAAVPMPGSKVNVHPYVYDLAQTAPGGTPALPRFAYGLGVLKTRAVPVTAETPYDDTNYGVIVDVAGSEHAVWLVYDRNPYDSQSGGQVAADPTQTPAVFAGVGAPNPDAAQVVAALKSWSLGTALPTQAAVEGSVKSTARQGPVVVNAALLDDIAKVLPLTNRPAPPAGPPAA
jgi:hypothetical protein